MEDLKILGRFRQTSDEICGSLNLRMDTRINKHVGAFSWSFLGRGFHSLPSVARTPDSQHLAECCSSWRGCCCCGSAKTAPPFLTHSCAGLQDALAKAVAAEMSKQYAKAVEPVAPRLPNSAAQGMDEEEVRFL
jgi:hypothetical protein